MSQMHFIICFFCVTVQIIQSGAFFWRYNFFVTVRPLCGVVHCYC